MASALTQGKFQLGMTGAVRDWRRNGMKVDLHLSLTDWYRHGET